jgi:hypothetical protein
MVRPGRVILCIEKAILPGAVYLESSLPPEKAKLVSYFPSPLNASSEGIAMGLQHGSISTL